MMISRAQINQILKVYRTSSTGKLSPSARPDELPAGGLPDALSISVSPQDVSMVKSVIKNIPEVREEKVREISRRLREGTYHVEPEEVAEKLLGRLMADKLR
ncbi:MAG TPA: flagellar biosynthesis anti-sigma factor FlgM [Firmicutes bacterium]|nr:flagellar biosynthesis anti-sigma factor FlgM [Candidatus Fermentithermobacillaceae bacterium]